MGYVSFGAPWTCVLCAFLLIISPSRVAFRRESRAAVDIMPVAGLDSSRAGVEGGVNLQESKTTGPSVQLQILSQYADKVFNDLTLLIDSFDSRVSKLTSKVSSDPVKENSKFREQRSAIATPYDKNRKQVPFMKCDNVSLLNPESRDERYASRLCHCFIDRR